MTVTLQNETATAALGTRIAQGLRAGEAVLLSGELGAGKTFLARAILRALGITELVPSPSFTLVQAYESPRLTLRHFDLYRITHERELEELGLEDALDDGAIVVEWPERALGWFPENALSIELHVVGENTRRSRISGPAHWRHRFTDLS